MDEALRAAVAEEAAADCESVSRFHGDRLRAHLSIVDAATTGLEELDHEKHVSSWEAEDVAPDSAVIRYDGVHGGLHRHADGTEHDHRFHTWRHRWNRQPDGRWLITDQRTGDETWISATSCSHGGRTVRHAWGLTAATNLSVQLPDTRWTVLFTLTADRPGLSLVLSDDRRRALEPSSPVTYRGALTERPRSVRVTLERTGRWRTRTERLVVPYDPVPGHPVLGWC